MVASWLPLSLLYTWTTAFSACAANTCDALTAKQLGAVELFLKPERRTDDGCSVWIQMPTSFSAEDAGAFEEANVDATKLSESISASGGAVAVSQSLARSASDFFALDLIKRVFARFVARRTSIDSIHLSPLLFLFALLVHIH